MSMKEQYDFEALWSEAKRLVASQNITTFEQLSEMLGVKRTTLNDAFRRRYGGDAVKRLFLKEAKEEQETTEAEYGHDYINLVCASRRITTVDEAVAHFKIDLNEWEIDRFRVKTSEGYRKDRKVQWEVKDGKTSYGKVEDSGKMLVVPMYHIQVTLKRKQKEVRGRMVLQDLLLDMKRHAPKYRKPKTMPQKSDLIYEVDIPDIHFGKLTWAEESGHDYDLKIARKLVLDTLEALLSYAAPFRVRRILLPMGNDFFNVDNKFNTTTHGTPQQEDTRWTKTFREGRRLAVDMIDRCAAIAPVQVVIVPGNHDEERAFYLGEVLDAFYSNAQHVTVDNSAKKRKYVHFDSVLLGFTHGYHEKLQKLPSIMPIEAPDLWAKSQHREWHLGDKHHKKDLLHRTEDVDGVTIRLLRSLSATDAWHFDKGYVGNPRSAEGFLWDGHDGLVAQFQRTLKQVKG